MVGRISFSRALLNIRQRKTYLKIIHGSISSDFVFNFNKVNKIAFAQNASQMVRPKGKQIVESLQVGLYLSIQRGKFCLFFQLPLLESYRKIENYGSVRRTLIVVSWCGYECDERDMWATRGKNIVLPNYRSKFFLWKFLKRTWNEAPLIQSAAKNAGSKLIHR